MVNPWLLLGVVALCALSALGGAKVESDHRDAQQLVLERSMHDAYVQAVDKYRGVAQGVSAQLNQETAKRESQKVSYDRKLRDARRGGVVLATCQPAEVPAGRPNQPAQAGDVQPVGPRLQLTRELGSLYNDALALAVPESGDTWRADVGTPETGSFDINDILANLGENAKRWGECRSALMGWQALARRNGWTK